MAVLFPQVRITFRTIRYFTQHHLSWFQKGISIENPGKLEAEDYDCILLAKIGLERVDLGEKIEFVLEPTDFPYAVSQGAFGVECRTDDAEVTSLLKRGVSCQESSYRCLAERSLLSSLEGGCQISMGVRSSISLVTDRSSELSSGSSAGNVAGNMYRLCLFAQVLKRDGSDAVESEIVSESIRTEEDAVQLGKALAGNLLKAGVERIVGYSIGKERRPITYGSMETAGIQTEGFDK